MAQYSATVEDTSYPLGYIKWFEAKRIDAINRKISKDPKVKDWPGLELPKAIKLGHYFVARFDQYQITIWKD